MGQLTNKFNYAWYGTCDEHSADGCKPYIFDDNLINLKSSVEVISTYNKGTLNTSEFFRPDDETGTLKSFECGAMYSIVLKTGKKFNLPGLTPAGTNTIKLGENQLPSKISFDCENLYEPTPTPSPFDCIPDNSEYTSVVITTSTSMQIMINGAFHTFEKFSSGDVVGIDMSYFKSGLAGYIVVENPITNETSVITLTGLEPKEDGGALYLKRGETCYRGQYKKEPSGIYRVVLEVINGVVPTPVPVPTPTPNIVDCNCVDDSLSSVVITSQGGVESDDNTFNNFPTGAIVSYDPSTFTSSSASIIFVKYSGQSLASSIELTGKKPSGSTVIHVKLGNQCLSGGVVSKSGFYEVVLNVTKVLDSSCGDSTTFPTPTPQIAPTPTPVEPTPTPKPIPTDCCPSTSEQIKTLGVSDAIDVKKSLQGVETSVFEFRGFENGGKLCVDLTIDSGSTNDFFKTTKLVFLNSDSGTAVGTVKKTLENGDKNAISYTDVSGNCWTGEIVQAETRIVLQSSSDSIGFDGPDLGDNSY